MPTNTNNDSQTNDLNSNINKEACAKYGITLNEIRQRKANTA